MVCVGVILKPWRECFASVDWMSVSNSTNAMSLRPGTRRTSLKPGNLLCVCDVQGVYQLPLETGTKCHLLLKELSWGRHTVERAKLGETYC